MRARRKIVERIRRLAEAISWKESHSWEVVNEPIEPQQTEGKIVCGRTGVFLENVRADYLDLADRTARGRPIPAAHLVVNEYVCRVETPRNRKRAPHGAFGLLSGNAAVQGPPVRTVGIQGQLSAPADRPFTAAGLREVLRPRWGGGGVRSDASRSPRPTRHRDAKTSRADGRLKERPAGGDKYSRLLDAMLDETTVKMADLVGLSVPAQRIGAAEEEETHESKCGRQYASSRPLP